MKNTTIHMYDIQHNTTIIVLPAWAAAVPTLIPPTGVLLLLCDGGRFLLFEREREKDGGVCHTHVGARRWVASIYCLLIPPGKQYCTVLLCC
jgi:hypothetical protein